MKRKFIIVLVLFFLFLANISAKEVEVYKLSEYDLEDELKVQVSMVDGSGKPIKDAKLEVLDESQKKVIEWKSYDEAVIITNLEEGVYYLVQSSVPEGYEKIEDKIKFEVSDSDVFLELVSAEEFYVPGTMSSNSVLLIFIGMFDIALGIGILVYVKKNKA